MPEEEEE